MRAHIFNAGFWGLSAVMAILFSPVLLLPGRAGVAFVIHWHGRAFRAWLRLCGVKVEYRGLHHVRAIPAAVFAAKHQSWGDGLLQVARDRELAYVIGDHMLAFPLVGFYLKKAGAVVVDATGGGRRAPGAFEAGVARLTREGRAALIFPEGGIADIGSSLRYRKGAHKLARALERDVIPVATNLGCFWPRKDWTLTPGVAVIEFLAPMTPGPHARTFMAELEERIETRTRALEAEALRAR
ncbi:1-acyl-sn-glycerol-3-phosphate acyltransferase [Alkalicaulis satelles]|uniref:1-acyl-sn-glycerol-3-phosphate acyltransferase n=1 Tax=Alkalicaulis satelles TaxID=2609175 RepID=A0A5M6ZNB7_9PROT|nr:lysophospholipid acyltransferase family protein [Alkalicaulis satelles]KAA5804738.1 1-acyl-sn-glycerol-3-phosphate acyltransferase [Alkalicaulis satelles]